MLKAALCILAVSASPSFTFNDDPVAPTVCVAKDQYGHTHEIEQLPVELQSPVRQ
jgi:hypothetical protein